MLLRDKRTDLERRVAEFNERQRRKGSRKRWHDYYPNGDEGLEKPEGA